jgi:hypothetical protein
VLIGTLGYGFVQFIGLLAAFQLCGYAIGAGHARLRELILYASGVAVTLRVAEASVTSHPYLYYLFLPTTHVGSFWMVSLCCGLALWIWRYGVRGRSGIAAVTTLCLLNFAAGLSDLLFVVHLTIALTCAGCLGLYLRLIGLRRTALILGLTWFFSLSGWAAKDRIFSTTPLPQGGIDQSLAALRTFILGMYTATKNRDPLHISSLLFYTLSTATVLWLISKHYFGHQKAQSISKPERLLTCFLVFQICSGAGSLLAPVFMGIPGLSVLKDYGYSMKYMFPFFIGPLFTWPILATYWLSRMQWTERRVLTSRAVGILAAVLVVWPLVIAWRMPVQSRPLHSSMPPFTLVRQMDSTAKRFGVQYGVGGFWETRWINLLSQSGLRAYPINDAMEPFGILSNFEWYRGSPKSRYPNPKYRFIFLNGAFYNLSREVLLQKFGSPIEEIEIDGIQVFIYGENQQDRINEMFRCSSDLNQLELSEHGSVSIPAACLPAQIGVLDGSIRKTDHTGRPGYLAYGPYYKLAPGHRYLIIASLDASGRAQNAIAHWDITFTPDHVIAKGLVTPGMKEIHAVITVPPRENGLMETRIVDLGNGILQFRSLFIHRLSN